MASGKLIDLIDKVNRVPGAAEMSVTALGCLVVRAGGALRIPADELAAQPSGNLVMSFDDTGAAILLYKPIIDA